MCQVYEEQAETMVRQMRCKRIDDYDCGEYGDKPSIRQIEVTLRTGLPL